MMARSLSAAYEEAMRSKTTQDRSLARMGGSYNRNESMPRVVGQNLVGSGYPDQGTIQPSHMGSQSASPTKLDNYVDANMDVPPIDRGAYGPGY